MSDDIKKLLSIMNETTTSGAVAPVAGGMGKSMLKRPADSIFAAESVPQDADTGLEASPKVDSPANFEYWKNSATITKEQSGKHGRNKTKKYPQLKETRNRRDAYQRDYDSSVSGMGKRDSLAYKLDGGANDEGWDEEPRSYQPRRAYKPQQTGTPSSKGMYFYNVPTGKEQEAIANGLKQTKTGKWFSKQQNMKADSLFGKGKYWEPKNKNTKSVIEGTYKGQFSSKEEAVDYAKNKAKTLRDQEDGIEIWAMPGGTFDVVATMNSNGRNHCVANGGEKLGTVGPRYKNITEGYPTDNQMGIVAGTNNEMTLGQWKQMWQKKMPNADMSLFRFPPAMQGSAIAYFDGWENTPGARWDPQQGNVSEAVQINNLARYVQQKIEKQHNTRRVDPTISPTSSRGYDSNERNFPVHSPEKKTPDAVIHIEKNELEEGIDKDSSNLDPYKHVSNRVSNPKISGTENRAKSAYYPPTKPPVKKLDKPLPESEQKTVAKTWDQMTPKEKLSGVKGRTVWNKKTKKYYTVFDVPVSDDEKLKEYSEWDGTGAQDLAAATAASGYEAGFADIEDKTSLSEAEITEEMIADRLKNELALFKKGTKSKDKSIGKKPADKEVQPKEQKKESDEPKAKPKKSEPKKEKSGEEESKKPEPKKSEGKK